MAVENIYWKIVKYLEANSKTEAEFAAKNIKIQNDADGNGDYIKVWTVDGLDKPTDSQLDALASNATTELLTQPLVVQESEIIKVQASDANELHVIASILEIQPREVTT